MTRTVVIERGKEAMRMRAKAWSAKMPTDEKRQRLIGLLVMAEQQAEEMKYNDVRKCLSLAIHLAELNDAVN